MNTNRSVVEFWNKWATIVILQEFLETTYQKEFFKGIYILLMVWIIFILNYIHKAIWWAQITVLCLLAFSLISTNKTKATAVSNSLSELRNIFKHKKDTQMIKSCEIWSDDSVFEHDFINYPTDYVMSVWLLGLFNFFENFFYSTFF